MPLEAYLLLFVCCWPSGSSCWLDTLIVSPRRPYTANFFWPLKPEIVDTRFDWPLPIVVRFFMSLLFKAASDLSSDDFVFILPFKPIFGSSSGSSSLTSSLV